MCFISGIKSERCIPEEVWRLLKYYCYLLLFHIEELLRKALLTAGRKGPIAEVIAHYKITCWILKSNETPQGRTKLTWAAPLLSSTAYDLVAHIYNTKRQCEYSRTLETLKNDFEMHKSASITRSEKAKPVKKKLSKADLDVWENLLLI